AARDCEGKAGIGDLCARVDRQLVCKLPSPYGKGKVDSRRDITVNKQLIRRQIGPPASRLISDQVVDLAWSLLPRLEANARAGAGELKIQRVRVLLVLKGKPYACGRKGEGVAGPLGAVADARLHLSRIRNE